MEWKRSAFDWNQARAFLVTAEEGSLSAAARALGLTQPTLSRQVAGLEEALGVTLFERTSRALLLTKSGVELLAHFRTMGDAANAISVTATGQSDAVTGHVVISATDMMATYFLPPILKKLRKTAPDLQIEIVASNEVSDLRRREADIAIRHGRPTDEALFAKRLRDTTAHLFASKQYLDEVGRPKSHADLSALTFVGFDRPELRLGLMASRGVNLTTANFNFLTSSATLMLELVRQGFGIGILPVEVGAAYPELENPFSAFEPLNIETWLVAHRELKTNLRIRVVFDLLAEGIG
ncbi:LysR family transcriptional regulator [Sulfitobacter geojensis]|uniref:LysR family transcriptional regulator n=1 Tax=Sulfitobacter geojensis TaxID=1342299 RepID=A0AAE3B8J2_9RHOB|nr:LysR family transcriptional regulator [Sulfitobacter geojensis]MBM1690613.1 LysR family transcriptional regulator [Sulfitobacter geojensis]MBM1694679.1 LysR family transcriptional regulator [Sulfitobacter geojensis]MBM1707615.1 LysR family transcriptional regulator [Sulfitobacter geojensis]MBM1711225.1 LysR family transcriptional regulator [Sulfitobacter geojensis]MBM1715740.1 LysR family transcriptional regulator [Sulfitobacter geojensis]